MFGFLGLWDLKLPRPGIEPAPPTLEGKVLVTGSPGKSLPIFVRVLIPHCPFLPPDAANQNRLMCGCQSVSPQKPGTKRTRGLVCRG